MDILTLLLIPNNENSIFPLYVFFNQDHQYLKVFFFIVILHYVDEIYYFE